MVSLQELKINKRKKNNNYWVSLQVVASRRFFLFWCVFQFNLVQINNDYCTLSWPCREKTNSRLPRSSVTIELQVKKKKWANVTDNFSEQETTKEGGN